MTTVWRMLRRRSRRILGSDDTRRYRATDSDAITHDKNTYGVYLQTPEPTLVPLTTVTMERLEFPSSDHGTHSTCAGKAIRTHSTNRWTHIWELNKGIIYQLHICFISVYSISNTLSHTVVTLFDCTHTHSPHTPGSRSTLAAPETHTEQFWSAGSDSQESTGNTKIRKSKSSEFWHFLKKTISTMLEHCGWLLGGSMLFWMVVNVLYFC